MPTTTTDFYGRHDETLEPLYQAAIANLTRETYQSIRDERAARIVKAVNEFLDLDRTSTADGPSASALAAAATPGPVLTAPSSQANQPSPEDAHTPPPLSNTGDQKDTTTATDDSGVDVEALRSTYQNDAGVRLLVDHFGSRQRNQTVSPLDTLERALDAAGAPLARHLIIDALRRLDVVGVGRFLPGRKGYPTRFEWNVKSLQTRALATSDNALL